MYKYIHSFGDVKGIPKVIYFLSSGVRLHHRRTIQYNADGFVRQKLGRFIC